MLMIITRFVTFFVLVCTEAASVAEKGGGGGWKSSEKSSSVKVKEQVDHNIEIVIHWQRSNGSRRGAWRET